MSNMLKKKDFSRKIIKMLAEKPAISIPEITKSINLEARPPSDQNDKKEVYAITRSIKRLEEAGFIESIYSGQNDYARLTKIGRKKAHSLKLENDTTLLSTTWDGYFRIILLDMPENRKSERDALRYLLKKAGFICMKNSVWISMYPYEHLFKNIKKDLNLSTELIILVTNKLDEDTEQEFLKLVYK